MPFFQAIHFIMRPYTLALFFALAVLTSGCGIKGNLYMPDVPTAQPAPEPAADDNKAPAANPQ